MNKEQSGNNQSQSTSHPPQLIRAISLWDFTSLVINITVGAGILGLPAKLFQLLGMNSLWALGGTALFIFIMILCFAEVGSRFNNTGGAYLYALKSYGKLTGFIIGWLLWLSRLFSFASVCNLLVDYAAYLWPHAADSGPRMLIIISVLIILGLLNYLGIKPATFVNNLFTYVKLTVLISFVVIGLFYMHPVVHPIAKPFTWHPFLSCVLLLVFAFSGFDVAAIPAGEVKNPHKTIPKGLIIAIVIVTLLFIGIQWVCMQTLPGLATSGKPVADSAKIFIGPAGAVLITIGALVTVAGTLNVLLLTSSRLLFAMAEQKQLPVFISKLNRRYLTPSWSIVISGIVILFLTLNSSFVSALTFSAIIRIFVFISTCLALPLMRRNNPAAPFTVKGGVMLAIIAIIICIILLFNIDYNEAFGALIATAIGVAAYTLYVLFLRVKKVRGER
jgi:APA family basic amino acid/polyamine antiporter